MTNKKTTKRALVMSVLSLVLCVSMFVGTTFAWFTDEVVSSNNIIKSGSLDVEMFWSDNNTDWTDASTGAIFDYKFWEPGYTEVKYIKIKNVGDLALRYQMNIIPDVLPAAGAANLADVIDVYVLGANATRADVDAATPVATLAQLMAKADGAASGTLLPVDGSDRYDVTDTSPEGEIVYCIALKMKEEAGNEYQNLTVGNGFSVQLLATQYTWEKDTFDDLYDDFALVADADALKAAIAAGKDVMLTADIALNADAAIVVADNDDITLDLNGHSIIGTSTASGGNRATFTVKGELVVTGSGAVSHVHTGANMGFGNLTAPFSVEGGKLTLDENVAVLNLGGSDMAYAVDVNTTLGETELNVNGATLYSTYIGVRIFNNHNTAKGTVNLNAGEIQGAKKGYDIWAQQMSAPAENAVVNIADGISYTEEDLSGKMYYIDSDVIFVSSAENLKAALEAGGEYVLLQDIEMPVDAKITVTGTAVLDMAGFTVSGTSSATGANYTLINVTGAGDLTVKNGTVESVHTGANMGWSNSTNVLEAVSGGKLTLVNATVKNLGGSDMAYGVNIGNNGGATLKTVNSTIESANYVALRVFNNADGAVNIDLTENSVLTGSGSPFWVHFWTEADLGSKMAARQAYLNVNFNDTEVSRYSGSKSLFRFGFTDALYFSDAAQTEIVAGSEAALKWAIANGKNVLLNNDLALTAPITIPAGAEIDLDLNGKTLSGTCNGSQGYLIDVQNGAVLNIKDTSADESGKIAYAQGTSNVGWAIDLEGELNLYKGTIELTGDSWSIGYCVDVRPNAWGTNYAEGTVFNMYGGKVISSDGAIRVASSSSDTYANITASFYMYGGEINAAWDGIFVQQSNAAYDTLNVEINDGKIVSALSPIRVYAPTASSVNSGAAKPMTITINGGDLSVDGTPDASRVWHTLGKIVLGGGITLNELNQYATITIA